MSPPGPGSRSRVDVHLTADDIRAGLRADVAAGLTAVPKELPPKWFYDERGSRLFDEITRLPEYYPTRCERAILAEHADAVAGLTGADTLVELGSGTSEKTRFLLDALRRAGCLRRFVPFDVSETTLRTAAAAVAGEYAAVQVHAVVGDFDHHLGSIPGGGRRLIAFLGGTIGNLDPKGRADLLAALASGMAAGDALLLGTDLVKDEGRLLAAYDDARGVTAAFNRNVLRVVNRELHADFAPERFAHVARYDAEAEWVEMWLRAEAAQVVTVADLALTVRFAPEEAMRTEISAKFRRAVVEDELAAAGLALGRWWTDRDGDFALSLAFRE
ncbi:MAG TPA: L-histidine N(alpha)-methyltransferase [Acidimicrobiales bacterium]|nr:L-histidine N(alpha)-methyltransferase [Acidimicrobiales bacterium]